jgi:putative ABC transport system ATP-binding protein
MNAPALRANGVSVTRGGDRILADLSVTIDTGDRVLIQGPSGAGKTTLFRLLGLLMSPDEGSLMVGGTDASELAERRRARLRRSHVGLVFQDFQLIPDLTAWENARVPQEHGKGDGTADEPWLQTLFSALDITDRRSQYPHTLSGGEKQRVAIARALANRPDVVLADEPTGQLDPDTAAAVLELFLSLQADTGTALCVISHDRDIADEFSDIYTLHGGSLGRRQPRREG